MANAQLLNDRSMHCKEKCDIFQTFCDLLFSISHITQALDCLHHEDLQTYGLQILGSLSLYGAVS